MPGSAARPSARAQALAQHQRCTLGEKLELPRTQSSLGAVLGEDACSEKPFKCGSAGRLSGGSPA